MNNNGGEDRWMARKMFERSRHLQEAVEELRREERERKRGTGGEGTTVAAEIAPVPRGEDRSPPYDSLGGEGGGEVGGVGGVQPPLAGHTHRGEEGNEQG